MTIRMGTRHSLADLRCSGHEWGRTVSTPSDSPHRKVEAAEESGRHEIDEGEVLRPLAVKVPRSVKRNVLVERTSPFPEREPARLQGRVFALGELRAVVRQHLRMGRGEEKAPGPDQPSQLPEPCE